MLSMAQRNGTSKTPAFILLLAILVMALLELSAASTGKHLPSRALRFRAQSAKPGASPSQALALRSRRRFRGQISNTGENTGRITAPLMQTTQNQENKQRASESVHVVSVQSMNSQEKSQPVYRAAVTKLKIPEDGHLKEPKDLGVRVISSQSVLVTWMDPMHEKMAKVGANRQYMIRYREKGESARWDYKNVNIRRALVDNLVPDAMYEFSVRITQDDNEGPWSASVFQRTPESAPTNAPDGLYVEPLNGKKTAVRAMWDELSDSNGRIKEYIISYAPAMKPFGAKSITYSATTTSAIIDGLIPGERYIFKIRAANRRGQGPQSKAFTVIMPESSTSINNLHTQSHTEDLDNEEEEEEEDEEEEVKIKQTAESKPSVSKSSLGETSEYFVRKRQQVQERSESKVQVPSILKHPNKKVSDLDNSQTFDNKEASETTTTAPKTSAPALRRRIRPFSNPLHSRTKMTGQNPSSVVTQDNETKTPDVKDSGSHATFEGIGTSTNIDDDSNVKIKNEEHSNEQSVPSKHPTEGRSHTEKGDSKPDLVGRKSSLASPVSIPVGKGTTSTNQRSAVSKLPTGQGNARLPSKPMRPNSPNQKNGSSQQHPTVLEEEQTLHENIKTKHSHETLKIKPESTVITSRKINPNIKKQSHSPLLLSQSKESTSSAPHDSRHFDIETREEKQSGSKDNRFFDQSDKRPHSARHPEKSIQAKKNDDKQSRHYDHALVKSKAQTEIEKKTKKTTLSGYKTIMTTAMTTLRTEPTTMSTTTVTATTESPTTYKSNRREINEYKPKETDVKSTSPIQKPAVNSNPKKSALSLLEYYRRRSSEVKNNVGTKVKANSISVAPTMVSVYATTTMLATTTTTTKHLEYSKQDKTVKTNVGSAGSTARMTPAPYKPLSKHKASRHPQDKSIPISSKPRISKTLDGKSLTSVVKSKPEDVYDIPKEKQDVSAKIEQAKPITLSRIPAKANQEHPKKATAVQDVKQTAHDEETVLHNMKSTTTEHSQHSLVTTHGNRLKSRHDLKKEEDSNATKFTKHSSAPSSSLTQSSKVDSTVLQKAISAQDKNTKVDSEAGNKPSRSSSLHTEGNKNIGFRRTPISKPSSETVDHLHHGASATSKPKLSTADILKVPAKPQQFAKVQDPTPPSKAKQPYSNDGGLKHRNINGDAFEKNLKENVFSQEQSEKLKDEEGLTVPLTIKESTQKPPGFRTSYRNNKYAILTRKLNTAGTKAPATTNHPQTTRPNQYRLLPTVARKINFGSSSSIVRTTHLPTTTPVRTPSPTYSPRPRILNSRFGYQGRRPFGRPFLRQGANGRQIPTTRNNGNVSSSRNGNLNGQRIIFGPQGTKWVVDLNRGLVLNPEGRYLQDSTGKPLRIKLGGDGRTIIDMQGTPVVSPDGLPLFGHGRFSKPVASPQDKPVLSLGGRPLRGLEVARTTRIPTTRMTTTLFTTRPTTTTPIPTTTTTPEPTTELATIEPTTEEPFLPTCPPGSYTQYDEEGNLIMGHDNKPDCYEEDSYSGEDLIVTTKTPYLDLDQDYDLFATTLAPIKTTEQLPLPDTNSFNTNLVSEYDVAGKKRFTAPYVSYINKDPNTPCSLTDALEHFQVENLEDIIPKDLKGEVLPPQKISYNITIVAVEGCHSFVILDWAKPKKGDFITGYLVYSASYDDFLRNKWSARNASATNFPVENLKPNTRYYFKIQAKNPFGFGPMSPHVSFVTESDNPLLIVRPPGGEPIWIPFAFKHDTSYSGCNGKQYVKRTWYRKFVGVVLCNSLRYKIYLSENLRDTFYSIGDSWGSGEDHCQFVDSYMDGRTGPLSDVDIMPMVDGYYRQYVQEPVMFGRIGFGTPHNYVGWYECGVPIPGKW